MEIFYEMTKVINCGQTQKLLVLISNLITKMRSYAKLILTKKPKFKVNTTGYDFSLLQRES